MTAVGEGCQWKIGMANAAAIVFRNGRDSGERRDDRYGRRESDYAGELVPNGKQPYASASERSDDRMGIDDQFERKHGLAGSSVLCFKRAYLWLVSW